MRKRRGAKLATIRPGLILTAALMLIIGSAWFAHTSAQPSAQPQSSSPQEPASARNENLEIAVRAGLGRLEVNHWNGSWVPFRVSLSNHGPAISGRLVIHCESNPNPTPQIREYVKEIQLPTGANQLHEIAAFLNSGENPIVRVMSGDDVLIETTIPVQRSFGWSDQLEIAVVDTDSTALNNISSAQVMRQPNRDPFKSGPGASQQGTAAPPSRPVATLAGAQAQSTTPSPPPPQSGPGSRNRRGGPQTLSAHPVVVLPEDLPRDFISYDSIDALVLNEAPLNQLTEEQSRALRLWVASGGLLIVAGGADVAGMRVAALDGLLPVEIESAATSSSAQLSELTQIYGPFESNEQQPALTAEVKDGARAILGSAVRPIVAERNYGSGLVRFLAINPKANPYRGWAAAKDLWIDLLMPAYDTKPKHSNWITYGVRGQNVSSRWGVQGYLYKLAEIGPPSAKYVIFFLITYALAVGPLNYAILRWRKKTDLAWLTIPAVVIVFTLVSVTVAQMSRGSESLIADVSVVELNQRDGLANISGGLLIMPASKGNQQLTFSGRDTYASDVANGNQSSSASASGAIESERGQRDFTLRVPMSTWTSGLFQVRSVKEGESPLFYANESQQTVTIKNLGSGQISKAVYLSPAGVSDLFDIAPGSQQTIALTNPPNLSFTGWYGNQLGQDNDEGDVFREIAGMLDREIGGDRAIVQGFFETQMMSDALKRLERPLVIGFIEQSPADIAFKGSIKRRSKSFYVIHL
jgi:hypothetical protein